LHPGKGQALYPDYLWRFNHLEGNGAGPGIWLLVSIPINNMFKTASFGFRVCTAILGYKFAFVCYTFMDNSDVNYSCLDTNISDDTASLASGMQEAVDT
jgi:hypothetical protein